MKYIHTYNTIEEFERDYNNDAQTDVVSITCEIGTFDYYGEGIPFFIWKNGDVKMITIKRNVAVGDSTAEYDSDGDGIPALIDEDEADTDEHTYEITAVNGDSFTCDFGTFTYDGVELIIPVQQPVNFYSWRSGDIFLLTQNRNPIVRDTCANIFESAQYEITAVETTVPDSGYFEPWVSYTRENEAVHYNKLSMINFQPKGRFTRADFGITQEMIDNWIEIYENHGSLEEYGHGSLEEYGVLVFSNPITRVYKSDRMIVFYSGEPRAYIGLDEDYVRISLTDGDK